jgi:hypothetical protein
MFFAGQRIIVKVDIELLGMRFQLPECLFTLPAHYFLSNFRIIRLTAVSDTGDLLFKLIKIQSALYLFFMRTPLAPLVAKIIRHLSLEP